MEAGIHAREWLAPATIIYIIDKVVETFANNLSVSSKDKFDN